METDARFRHELKYGIDYAQYLALRARLRPVMRPDEHAGADGTYTIRSIYLDSYTDKALREKLIGAPRREKFRIRWYNEDLSFITLEKKQKIGALTKKLDAAWTQEELRAFLRGERSWMMAHPSPLTRELYVKMTAQRLAPRVVVCYTREPYVFFAGNVRVTFDFNIRSSLYTQDFLDAEADICVEDEPGRLILEVKYDDFLPEVIAQLLQVEGCRQEAFSKYGAARRFG